MKLSKVYEPGAYEQDIYALWEKAESFVPKGKGECYSIVMPPPNANGNLHIGHALTLAIQDVLIRFHRLQGNRTLYLPGADHAGFETQVVYEKKLATEGKSRFDISREQLFQQIWEFVADNRGNFENQIRRLGASVDWQHYTFTLDDKIVKRAYATFRKMCDEGLIYRGERLVNFCTFHGTAFADIEVVHTEDQGHLWHIRYPLTDGSGEVVVATTRPETLLGDTGVAVHPDDVRYIDYIGKTVRLPLTNRDIPIIADEFVDATFGTGAVKLTPAHDINDYDAAERHDLPKLNILTTDGHLNHEVPEQYHDLSVTDARERVVQDLEAAGLIIKIEDYTHNVGHCYKCNTVIQPLLREQWFVTMKPLADKAIAALEADEIVFYPDSKKIQLINYLKNLRDWNISRQIAWGIPIPAFRNAENPDDWIVDERVDQETLEIDGKIYHRDPDVFDTWFSSSQWPFATLDYPDGEDYKNFYPLSVMETGFDILMPWVSRMLMLGLYVTGKVPFERVYLHGLVLDEHGQKMSKSKGNVINPLEVVDAYGSDAMRMGIISGQTPGNNQPFSTAKVVGARNFCNKLWNIARYIEANVTDANIHAQKPLPRTQADYWVLSKLQQTSDLMVSHINQYRISEAYDVLYHFVWDDFADWYIEASKAQPNEPLLAWSLKAILQMAHPFAPFLTETIWQTLAWETDDILATSTWPIVPETNQFEAASFNEVIALISEAREVLHEVGQPKAKLYYSDSELIKTNATLISRMAGVTEVSRLEQGATGLALNRSSERSWLDLDDKTVKTYLARLQEKQATYERSVKQLQGRLANTSYVEKAPEQVVAETRAELALTSLLLEGVLATQQRFTPPKEDPKPPITNNITTG